MKLCWNSEMYNHIDIDTDTDMYIYIDIDTDISTTITLSTFINPEDINDCRI